MCEALFNTVYGHTALYNTSVSEYHSNLAPKSVPFSTTHREAVTLGNVGQYKEDQSTPWLSTFHPSMRSITASLYKKGVSIQTWNRRERALHPCPLPVKIGTKLSSPRRKVSHKSLLRNCCTRRTIFFSLAFIWGPCFPLIFTPYRSRRYCLY